ncbi:MAG: hypothetical protein WAR76_19845 [Xanthobacteraceae bacterium]
MPGGYLKEAHKSMKAWVPADRAESNTPKPGISIGVLEKFLRWFAEIGRTVNTVTKHFLRPRHPASQFTAEQRAEDGAEEAGAVATATESAIGHPTTGKSLTIPITADVKVDPDAPIALDQEEIQRRRNMVRMLFNDFWSGAYERPAAFVERLDQAEDYVNERLAASGEFWQLDAKTRVTLGLPPRANSPNNGKNRA